MESYETLYLVSNGGELNGLGYFGWAISINKEIFVQYKGNSAGNLLLIVSLKTKNIGVISILCFIYCICVYHKTKITTNLCTHFCDNNTAVRSIKYSQSQNILNPTSALSTDYDIHAQIKEVLIQLKTPENQKMGDQTCQRIPTRI